MVSDQRTMTETLDFLRRIPLDQIRADLARVQAERARLGAEEELLHRVLALREDDTPSIPSAEQFGTPAISGTLPTPVLIKRLLAASPDAREWTPAEVVQALQASGVPTVKKENVRMALRRLTQRGELERGKNGYKLPPREPTLSESEE